MFKARFVTPHNLEFVGSVLGNDARVIMLSVGSKEYFLNKLLEKDSLKSMSAMLAENPSLSISTSSDIFPLRYATQIKMDPFLIGKGYLTSSDLKWTDSV